MFEIGMIVVIMFVLQGVLTYFQVKDYRANVSELRKKGNLFVGQIKGRMKAGSIVLMALDGDGKILEARSMTGITVFHRFRPIQDLAGKNISDNEKWLNQMKNKQVAKAIGKGIDAMNHKMEENVA